MNYFLSKLKREEVSEGLLTPENSAVNVVDSAPEEARLSLFQLFALTICFLGVQFGWAIQIAFTSPIFLELGVPKFGVSLVWLAGPISGLLVQPTVGVISDTLTFKWGRRRPFILGGAIFILTGMLLISNAADLGRLVGSPNFGIALAIIGFWILDLANNTVQGPCRALLVDVAPVTQQNIGGSFFSFMLGTGNFLGYFIGSLPLTEWLPFFGTDIRALFSIGMLVLATCITITVVGIKEIPLDKDQIPVTRQNPFSAIFRGIVNMPPGLRRICAVQFFAWFGWFTFMLYITTWVGENVFDGDPSCPPGSSGLLLFQEGVRFGALGLTIFSAVTVVCSVLFPLLCRIVGIRLVFFTCQIVLAICLFLTLWVKSRGGAIVLIAACGIPWTAVMVFPFTIVAMNVEAKDSGLFMGVLNIFVVIPQILVSVVVGFVVLYFNGNVVAALVTGSGSALLSAFLVWTLVVKEDEVVEISPNFAGAH